LKTIKNNNDFNNTIFWLRPIIPVKRDDLVYNIKQSNLKNIHSILTLYYVESKNK